MRLDAGTSKLNPYNAGERRNLSIFCGESSKLALLMVMSIIRIRQGFTEK